MISGGRGGETRTHGLVVPNDARYQTAPHPDDALNDAKLLCHRVALGVPNDARYHPAPHPDVLNDAKLLFHHIALGVPSGTGHFSYERGDPFEGPS